MSILQSLPFPWEVMGYISQQCQTLFHILQLWSLLLLSCHQNKLSDILHMFGQLITKRRRINSMYHTHQSFNDRILQSLSIVLIRNRASSLTTKKDKIHKFLSKLKTKLTNLQTKFSNTHQHIKFKFPTNLIFLNKSIFT